MNTDTKYRGYTIDPCYLRDAGGWMIYVREGEGFRIVPAGRYYDPDRFEHQHGFDSEADARAAIDRHLDTKPGPKVGYSISSPPEPARDRERGFDIALDAEGRPYVVGNDFFEGLGHPTRLARNADNWATLRQAPRGTTITLTVE